MSERANIETAKVIISQVTAQSELILTISTAVVGGTIAILFKLYFESISSTQNQNIEIKYRWVVILGVILMMISILLAYAFYGAIISEIPAIIGTKYFGDGAIELGDIEISSMGRYLSIAQFFTFFFGFVFVAVGFFKNIK